MYGWRRASRAGRLEEAEDAVRLARRGSFVDMDTTEPGLGGQIRSFLEQHGPPDKLTVSSDAHTPGGSPEKHFKALVSAIRDDGLALEQVAPCFTANVAAALKLPRKGTLAAGCDADLILLGADSLELRDVFACGRRLLADGRLARRE